MMAECNQAESSTRLVMMISLALSFFFLACAVGVLGIVFIMGVKLRDMERNIIEVLQKIQAERVTSRNTAILNSKAESGSYSDNERSDIDDYVIPNLDEAISTDVQPREKLISEAADTSMPTLCTRAVSKAQADGAAFEMDTNVAYEQHMHNRQ